MTDTSNQPAFGAGAANSGLGDSLNSVLKSAPELGNSPGLAVGVATSGGDPAARSQAVARGTNAVADASARQNVTNSVGGDISGVLNSFGNSVAHVVSDVVHPLEQAAAPLGNAIVKTLNAPMAYVQHEYRYLHDVEARHGQLAALGEGLGLAAGAAAGFALGGGVPGAVLGAEGAAALEGQVFYRDSWNRTTNGTTYTDPHTHMQVSFGRDIASVLGLRPGTLTFNVGSGLIDGIADLQVGGTEIAGLIGKARSVEGLSGVLGNYFPGLSAATAEDFEKAYTSVGGGGVRNMARDMAGKSAGEIIATPAYQSLKLSTRGIAGVDDIASNAFVQALGRANTADDVASVFRDALRTHELVGMDRIPTLSFTRIPFQYLREQMEGANGALGADESGRLLSDRAGSGNLYGARNFIRLPSSANQAGVISMKKLDPDSADAAKALYQHLMYTENRRTAASVVETFINSNHAGKMLIWRNSLMDVLLTQAKEFGLDPNTLNPNHLAEIKKALDTITGGAEPGAEGVMGLNRAGDNISYAGDTSDSDRQYAMAITDNQTGKLQMIQLGEMRSMAHAIAGYMGVFGQLAKADSFLYDDVTQRYFKPLVLLTPSYAMHIALAELIPNALRLGVRNMVKAGIAINAAKLGVRTLGAEAADKAAEEAADALVRAQSSGDAALIRQAEGRLNAAMNKAQEQRITAISGLAWRLVGMHKASTAVDLVSMDTEAARAMGRRIQLAARYIDLLGGDTVAPGLSAGHNLSAEVDREMRQTALLRSAVASSPLLRTNEFAAFARGNQRYMDSWQDWANEIGRDEKSRLAAQTIRSSLAAGKTAEEASNDAVARVSTWLREQPQSYLDKYDRALPSTKSITAPRPMGADQLDDWAYVTVENLKGATWGRDAESFNGPLLGKIADNERVDQETLEAVPESERPVSVKGQKFAPAPPPSGIRSLANAGFQNWLNPMVNFISREPIAFAEFEKQYALLVPKVTGGLMSEDEAMTTALAKTSAIVIRNVHNLTDRTQWTVTLRNWAPFFFAQEQAYRRMGRLLASDPAAFRKYQLMISNIHDVGQVLGGQNGQSYFVVPGTGWLTSAIPAAMNDLGMPVMGSTPVGMGWNLNSMSVIFPTSNGIRPDLGPVVAIPIQAIADFFPEAQAPALKADVTALSGAIIGSAAQSSPIWEQLVPNTIIDRLMQAAAGDQGGTVLADRSFASTMMQTMAALDFEHKLPTGPTTNPIQLQTVADRIRNQTRIMYVLKALLGAITPVSPEIQVQDSNLRTTYDADAAAWNLATSGSNASLASEGFSLNELGFPPALNADIKREGSLNKGILAYLAKNPDATAASVFEQVVPNGVPFTVSQSSSPSGAYITASVQAEQWMNDHASLITKYPMAAFYLMPQLTDTKYNAAIYNEQLAQGYRVKLNPATAQGVTGQTPSFLQQLYIAAGNAQFFGPNGPYTKYQQQINGLTAAQKYPIEQTFYNITLPQFGKQNPIWNSYWTSDNRAQDRDQAVSELQAMFRAGDAPPGKQTDEIRGLLKDYETYQSQLTWGTQDNFAREKQSTIDQGWTDYLESVVASHPELAAFVNGVFVTIPAAPASAGS